MPRKVKYTPVQILDGAWYRIRGYTHHECCDCALVHKEEYRMNDGHIEWRTWRDDRRTAQRRKKLKITVQK